MKNAGFKAGIKDLKLTYHRYNSPTRLLRGALPYNLHHPLVDIGLAHVIGTN